VKWDCVHLVQIIIIIIIVVVTAIIVVIILLFNATEFYWERPL